MRDAACVAASCAALLSISSCDQSFESPAAKSNGVRIASLSPAITATIVALGGEECLVGRTPWCQTAPGVAIVGSLLDLNAEALVAANPTHVFVQPPSQGSDPALDALAAQYQWNVALFHIESLADVERLVPAVAAAIADSTRQGDAERFAARAKEIAAQFEQALAPLASAKDAGSVLIVLIASESADAMAFGSGTYLGDFVDRIGAINALKRSGYPTLSTEELVRSQAQTIIVLGGNTSETVNRLRGALAKSIVVALDAPDLLQPGGGMIDALLRLRRVIADSGRAHAHAAGDRH